MGFRWGDIEIYPTEKKMIVGHFRASKREKFGEGISKKLQNVTTKKRLPQNATLKKGLKGCKGRIIIR